LSPTFVFFISVAALIFLCVLFLLAVYFLVPLVSHCFCTSCKKWVHRKCGIKGSMYKVMKTFVCRGCMNPPAGTGCTSVDIGVNANLESVDKFCYLGDMLTVDGVANAAVETRIRIGWNKFRECWYHCLPIRIYEEVYSPRRQQTIITMAINEHADRYVHGPLYKILKIKLIDSETECMKCMEYEVEGARPR